MPSEHPAADLIDEARFMRRMAKVVEVSAEKVEQLAAAARPALATGLTRLEVPTLSGEGWTPALLYVVRSERAKATPLAGIASMLEWMFRAEVTPQVLLAAIMHFDLDRRDEAPAPAELQAVQEVQEQQEQPAEPVADQPCDASAVVAHEAAPVGDEAPATDPAWPCPDDPVVKEPWAQKALAMHAEGEPPFRIARALKMHGATDFKVRCLLIPGFRGQTRDKVNAARGRAAGKVEAPQPPAPDQAREDARLRELRVGGTSFPEIAAIMKREGFKARSVSGWIGRADRLGINVPKGRPLPPVAVPKPQPREPETKPQPKPAPARRAAARTAPAVLPWAIPEREPGAGCNTEIPAPGKGLHIGELQSDHCRWLMGKGADGHETYCGCQKSRHGSAYCDAHAMRAYTEWPPTKPLKRPTRIARALSALPDARNRQHERTA